MNHILRFFLLLSIVSFVYSCKPDNIRVKKIDPKVDFHRFDQAFFNTDTTNFEAELNELKNSVYAPFFEGEADMRFWRNQRTWSMMTDLHKDVQTLFSDFSTYEKEIKALIKHYRYYFANDDSLHLYTYISGLDYDYPVLFADSYIFIGLDMYLGAKHPAYSDKPDYQKRLRSPKYIVPDLAETIASNYTRQSPSDASFISEMIYHGKVLFAVSQMLPELDEADLLRYSEEQIHFCLSNEKLIWRYFIEQQLLYNQTPELKRRFINPAPFSKFYMELDRESPGRIGRWIGYRIVQSYMKNHSGQTLTELMANDDHRSIFAQSKYKP